MLKGTITALVTPFKDGKIDYNALKRLIEFQIKNKTDGILIGGTTGESPSFNSKEYEKILDKSAEFVNGRAKLIAGTGTNNFETTLQKNKIAEKYNYDALLVITPYYNKPTQKGLEIYFKEVAIGILKLNPPSSLINILAVSIPQVSATIWKCSGKSFLTQGLYHLNGFQLLSYLMHEG